MICELEKREEIFDKSNWIKANPIVATSDYGMDVILGSKYQAAIDAPEKMRTFLTKNMNMWVDMRENGYMDMEKWRKCEANFTFEDFKNMDCIVGADLAKKIDLTSICFEFYKDGLYENIKMAIVGINPNKIYNNIPSILCVVSVGFTQ